MLVVQHCTIDQSICNQFNTNHCNADDFRFDMIVKSVLVQFKDIHRYSISIICSVCNTTRLVS